MPNPRDPELTNLECRTAAGDRDALARFMERCRPRLARMVSLRMDARVRSRIDPSDVLQESFLEAFTRFEEYRSNDDRMPLFLWLRFLAGQKLLQLHRRLLGLRRRDPVVEVSIYRVPFPEATSAMIAAQLVGDGTSPSEAVARAEMKLRLEEALASLDPIDREVLVLRHFEQLDAAETARVLGLERSAASKRYVRALRRLGDVLDALGARGGEAI